MPCLCIRRQHSDDVLAVSVLATNSNPTVSIEHREPVMMFEVIVMYFIPAAFANATKRPDQT